MSQLLKQDQYGADDVEDMVVIRLDDLRPMVPYHKGFEVARALRLGCKEAARYDQAPATFWRDVDTEDLNDCPKTHRSFRRSMLAPNVKGYEVRVNPPLVALMFDGIGREMGYEDGVKLHQRIRRASRRAKAWAGDTSRNRVMLGMLTSAEADDRLGLA